MRVTRYFDHLAIGLSAVCILHCLAVPLLFALAPVAAVLLDDGTHFHEVMLWIVVPTSLAGFALGYRVHHAAVILVTGAVGLALVALAALTGHASWPLWAELVVSIGGSLLLAGAHWRNFAEVRRLHRH